MKREDENRKEEDENNDEEGTERKKTWIFCSTSSSVVHSVLCLSVYSSSNSYYSIRMTVQRISSFDSLALPHTLRFVWCVHGRIFLLLDAVHQAVKPICLISYEMRARAHLARNYVSFPSISAEPKCI